MTPDARSTALAIGGMAIVTYLIRAGGMVIAQVLPGTPGVTAFLRHLGGSVIVALVTATLAKGDTAGLVATAVTVVLAARGRPTSALVAGMAVAALLRAV
ncbi:MAG: AzlD domain-containing protein [Acidobacteria bacterium]|nr:AzlD domain-containing protein [Acidobacteriota bacterium]